MLTLASFPGPCRFWLHEERRVVEITKLNVGALGLRTARRAKVPGTYVASGWQLLYTPIVELVNG